MWCWWPRAWWRIRCAAAAAAPNGNRPAFIWAHCGTNGKTAPAQSAWCRGTGKPAVVHRNDHFDAAHIGLSCTAAPVFDSQNRLRAVLNVSALTPVAAKQSQYWVLQLVKHFAALIETAAFIRNHRQDWLVRLGHTIPPNFSTLPPNTCWP